MSEQNLNVSSPNPSPSTPAGGDTPAPVATPTPVASPQPGSATPTPTAGAPTAPGQVPQGYVPSYRIRETRDQYEQRIAQMESTSKAEIERLTKQVQALTGVTPQNHSEEEIIRTQLFKIAPELKALIEMQDQLKEIAAQRDAFQQQNQHYWQSYNRTQMDRLFKSAEEVYGTALTDGQKRSLAASFVGWAQSDPELVERYQTDPSLINDFWKEFSSSFIEPVRRTTVTSAAGRVASNLPQDTPSGNNLRPSNAPDEPKDLDGKVDKAWLAFKQLRAGKG